MVKPANQTAMAAAPEFEAEPFLPLQLAAAAEATGALISRGLCLRGLSAEVLAPLTDETGELRQEIEPFARAYEAALLSGFDPDEVRALRRLLARLECAAHKLAGPQP